MRIGLISGEYPPMQGGVADFTRELARAFAGLGHAVFVLSGVPGVGADDPGVVVSACVRDWNRASLGRVSGWARQNRLDVVNLQYQTAAYRMAGGIHLLPRLRGPAPFVTTFHDLRPPYLFPKAGALRQRAVWMLARGSDAVIVTNGEDEERLRRLGGVARLRRIPIGSNIPGEPPEGFSREAWRERLGVRPGEVLVGYFGLLNRSKGVDHLLRALARLAEAAPPLKLLLIGGRAGASDPTNAAYAAEIDALVGELGLAERVLRTGYVDGREVGGYLRACDCCALPYTDGASLRRGSLMAALAHGCPILTTRPAWPEPGLVHGENVFLVEVGSAEALAAALQTLAAQPALRWQLGEGARRLADSFTWEHIAAQTVALYEELRE